jgi:hypothetical protein
MVIVISLLHDMDLATYSRAPLTQRHGSNIYYYYYYYFETEGRHANAKAEDAIDHLASFPSGRDEISKPGFEPPTSSLRFG